MRIQRGVAAMAVFGGLMGCSSTPDAELLAAVKPGLETPAAVSGQYLDSCIDDRYRIVGIRGERNPSQALYHPGYSYKFAERAKYLKPMSEWAPRMRAYVVTPESSSFLNDRARSQLICYYELNAGQLRFLTSVIVDHEGRGPIQDFNQAILTAYAILKGKNVWKVRIFGVLA